MAERRVAGNTPVIIGVGEIKDRPCEPAEGLEPLALMAAALREAERDAGAALLQQLDSLSIVCEVSWPYDDAPGLLAQRLGVEPRHRQYGEIGGETPVKFIHEAALRVARGECRLAAVVGAEAQYTVNAAAKAGVTLPWTPRSTGKDPLRSGDHAHRTARAHGIYQPITVYPLYENATAADWGQTPGQALRESGALWERYARAAAVTPTAWSHQPFSAEEIVTPTADNRLIAWPYTKRMVANPAVNLGAAVLVTTLAYARELGVPEERLVCVLGGAAASEPRDYLMRDQFRRSHAQEAVLEAAADMAGGAERFDLTELYSCFPVVPKMARRILGLADPTSVTTIGGLSFFGAPLNNYMLHAAAGMVRALRERGRGLGLLYGQGGFVTKHHGLLLGRQSDVPPQLTADYSVQSLADGRRGAVPPVTEHHSGPAVVETFTVVYDRDGSPRFGTVVALTETGERLLARVDASDEQTLQELTRLDRSPVGRAGIVASLAGELLSWRFSR
jgi:acetyl-CoA C-acetyltransferase